MTTILKRMSILVVLFCALYLTPFLSFAQTEDTDGASNQVFLPLVSSSENEQLVDAAAVFPPLRPTQYVTDFGGSGGQPVTNLHVMDQSGLQNDWYKYIELESVDASYLGYRVYVLPSNISPTAITSMTVQANYLGQTKSFQTWTWSIKDWTSGGWVTIGDNATAPSWKWKLFNFSVPGSFARYVNSSTREIQVRVESNIIYDNMDLDYEAVLVETGSIVTPTNTPTRTLVPPTNTPTRTPVPPTNTPTRTPVPPTNTPTRTPVPPTNTPVVSAREYYVAPNGSNGNVGSITAPWKTIQHAADNVLPGSTVFVRQGTYAEKVVVNKSGSASAGYITFRNYMSESVTLNGAGLVVNGDEGLFKIVDQSYIVIQGFEMANLQTDIDTSVPAAIWVKGTSHHIQIRNNRVHDIKTLARASGNAHGIAVYGSSPTLAISQVVISGNEVYNLQLGNSEAVVVNGNVDGFEITNNHVYSTDNIGIDVIGWEGTAGSTSVYDYARNGVVRGNRVHHISSYGNPAYGNSYAAAGVYVDGGRAVTIEQNIIYNTDYGIELASEHQGKTTSFVTARNNFIYNNNAVGIGIGGYQSNKGRTENCVIVNNTLFNNGIHPTGGIGEMFIQYNVYNNTILNNIFVATTDHHLIYSAYSTMSGNVFNYNLYNAPSNNGRHPWVWKGTGYYTIGTYRTASGNDGNSLWVNPQFVNTSSPNLHLLSSSPAINAGTNRNDLGTGDIDGETRVQGVRVDIGADEVSVVVSAENEEVEGQSFQIFLPTITND